MKKILFAILTIALVSGFSTLFLYCNNAAEVGLSEVLIPLVVFIVLGIIILAIAFCLTKQIDKAAIVACLFMIIVTNFAVIDKGIAFLLPSLRYWHTVPIVLVIAGYLSYFLAKKLSIDMSEIITTAICIAMSVLLMFNVITNISDMVQYSKNQSEIKHLSEKQDNLDITNTVNGLPNIYLLLFDEYAGFRQMEEYYGYDNAVLKDFLEANHFYISYDSHNEYYSTDVVLTNLMNLDYIVAPDTSSASERERIRKDNRLFPMLEELGYQTQVIETGNYLGNYSPTRDAAVAKAGTVNGETITELCFKQTIFYPFIQKNEVEEVSQIKALCSYMADKNNIPNTSTVTVFYVSFPHVPFLVDENGNMTDTEGFANWENDEYYLGQFKYATKLMIEILTNIMQNDPKSVVILQSDHGARGKVQFSVEWKTNILNCVYVQGKEADYIDGQSAVNTLRLILDDILNLELGLVPVPDYT